MNIPKTELPNSKAKLQERLQAGRITWAWPVMIVFARLIFAILAQTFKLPLPGGPCMALC
jgi:hypothetical protein